MQHRKTTVICLTLLIVGLVTGFALGIAFHKSISPKPLEIIPSLGVDDPTTLSFVKLWIKSMQWPDEHGTIYEPVSTDNPNKTLTLIGKTPLILPDDHGNTTLLLLDVTNDKAMVAVQSWYDHRWAGNDIQPVTCQIVQVDVTAQIQ